MAVEAQLLDDGAVERPDEEVGQEVGARLLVEEPLEARLPGVDVVAVQPREPLDPEVVADAVEGAVRPAVGVADDDPTVGRPQPGGQRAHLVGDPVRVVVQERGKGVDVDGPAAPRDDRGRRLGDRAARDQRHAALRDCLRD